MVALALGSPGLETSRRGTAEPAGTDPRAAPASPCVVSEADAATFRLYPPTPFAISDGAPRYKLLLPFGVAAVDLTLGNGPRTRRRLRPGDLVLARPGSRLVARHVEPLEFLSVTLAPERAEAAALSAVGPGWSLEDAAPWHDPAAAALGQEMRRAMIAEALPPPPYLVALADALLARYALSAVSRGPRAPRDPIAPAALTRVLRHIEEHIAEPIEVAGLASVAGLSPAHFARVFAQATGDPPRRFVTKRRVCRARDMLSGEDANVAQVAARTGFASQAHMSTVFVRELGLSPARYRAAFRLGAGAAAPADAIQARRPAVPSADAPSSTNPASTPPRPAAPPRAA